MPIPWFFQQESATAFEKFEMAEDDVVLATVPYGGATWVHKILINLLHGFDEEGVHKTIPTAAHTTGQVFVESIPQHRIVPTNEAEEAQEAGRRDMFGDWVFEMLVSQPNPRLFSTHMYGGMLPASLLSANGKGKLVVAVRNLKDLLVSTHFFRGEPKDGWLGNEYGKGSFERFLDPDTANAYGSVFTWVKEMDRIVENLKADERVLVVQYEDLVTDLPAQIQRVASFLGQGTLAPARLDAVVRASSFLAFGESRNAGMTTERCLTMILAPKGNVRDWCHHLTEDKWKEFDEVFKSRLANCPLAEKLLDYQRWDMGTDAKE